MNYEEKEYAPKEAEDIMADQLLDIFLVQIRVKNKQFSENNEI